MSRILWLSNAPWAGSGYGEQTALFLPKLQELGHDVATIANWGLQGRIDSWEGITVYPSDSVWGNANTHIYAEQHQADVVIALQDAFLLTPERWKDDLEMAVWAPIDHYPVPPAVLAVLAHKRITPIAMSRFGEQQMRDCLLDPVYVPHGVDMNVFYPRRQVREQARDALGIPHDAFLVGMVAANKASGAIHRKSFPQAFAAFARFAADHEDAWLYAHTRANAPGGFKLDPLAQIVGVPKERFRVPTERAWDLGISRDILATIYQAFDVLLAPSMGEGFGIPILEAQACGVPVITSNHSAMTELTHAGWMVDGDPFWDEASSAFFITPSIDAIVQALEAAYESRDDLQLRAAAADFAEGYEVDRVTKEFWKPALDRLLPEKQESRQVRRARERRELKESQRTTSQSPAPAELVRA